MKNILTIIALFALSLGATATASTVTDIQLTYENHTTVATITLEGQVRFSHETVEAKEGKPFRVLVDVLAAEHALSQKDYNSLPNCVISSIRTSQYSVSPEKIVRLVFDMKNESVYRVESEKNWIKLYFADKSIPPFASWSTGSAMKLRVVKNDNPSTAAVKSTPENTVASINNSIETDRQASLQDYKTTAAAKVNKTVPQPPVIKAPAQSSGKAVATQNTPETKSPAMSKSAQATATAAVKNTTSEKSATASKMTEAKKEIIAEKPQPKITKPEVSKSSVAKAGKIDVPYGPEYVSVPESKPVVADVSSTKKQSVVSAPPKESSSKPMKADTKPSAPVQKSQSEKPMAKKAEPAVQKSPLVTASADVKAVKKENKPKATVATKPSPKADKPAAKTIAETPKKAAQPATTKKVEAAPKKPVAEKSTSRFRRNPTGPTKIKGTLVAEFPKRLTIKYKARSRDPFETLINDQKVDNNPIERRVPNVEGLKLVGIIEADGGENRALFEDKSNFGYILQAGDKVQKGYVLRVEEDRVYFQIFEYGWSRTVALNIEEN